MHLTFSQQVWANIVDLDEMAHMSHLIWIFTFAFFSQFHFLQFFKDLLTSILTQWTLLHFKMEKNACKTKG